MQLRLHLVPVVLTALLALATPASAIFIETPLHMSADHTDVEVGDPVTFHIEPANESAKDHFAGMDVIVRWSMYEPDGTSQDPKTLRDDLRLDDDARLDFTWIIPAEADDRNVFVTIERDAEILAQANLVVGDAEPLLMAMSGEAPEPRPEQRTDDEQTEEPANVPGLGFLVAAGVLAAAVLVVRRR